MRSRLLLIALAMASIPSFTEAAEREPWRFESPDQKLAAELPGTPAPREERHPRLFRAQDGSSGCA